MPKRKNRFSRWLAMALTVVLLAGQSHVFVLAEEGTGDVPPTEVSDETVASVSDNDSTGDNDSGADRDEENTEDHQGDEDLSEAVSGKALDEEAGIDVLADEGMETYEVWEADFKGDNGIEYRVIGDAEVEACQSDTELTGSLVVPEKVTESKSGKTYRVTRLADNAFQFCFGLSSIDIPDSVTSIGEAAFYGCMGLRRIKIPNGVTCIRGYTFDECRLLSSVELPDSVTTIEEMAFYNCENLKSIKIPNGVTKLGEFAFQKCSNLKSIELPDNMTIRESTFSACTSLDLLRIVVTQEEARPATIEKAVNSTLFGAAPAERYIVFLDVDGTELTGTALNRAKQAYINAGKHDYDPDDGKWYGWIIGKVSEVQDTYTVTINVKKDGDPWNNHGRAFALLKSGGGFINASGQTSDSAYRITQVPNGTYRIYDVTGVPADSLYSRAVDTGMDVRVSGMDTTVTVTVNGKDENADVNYYTATFYDGTEAYKADTLQKPQIVLSGQRVAKPEDPSKADWQFAGWKTADGGSTPYDFESAVTKTIDIFASWIETTAEQLHITATATEGGTIDPIGDITVTKGGEQTFMITPGDGNRIKAVTVDGSDVTAGLADTSTRAQAGAKYYTFTNVTENHTIHAAFESDGSTSGDDGGDKPNPDGGDNDNSGGGGDNSGGGGNDDGGNGDGGDSGSGDEDSGDSGNGSEAGGNSPAGSNSDGIVSEGGAERVQNNASADSGKSAGNKEPKTGDASHAEVYATVAMIAGLTYLLLYFMEEGRGMSEREKEVFVAAFIRWAKKGGAFRRCCAIAAIFCLLAYYHSIGKRTGRTVLNEKYLGQVL